MAKKKKVEEKEIIIDESIIETTPEIKEIILVDPELVVPEVPEVVVPEVKKESKEEVEAAIVAQAIFLVSEIDGINLGGPGQRALDALKATIVKL